MLHIATDCIMLSFINVQKLTTIASATVNTFSQFSFQYRQIAFHVPSSTGSPVGIHRISNTIQHNPQPAKESLKYKQVSIQTSKQCLNYKL